MPDINHAADVLTRLTWLGVRIRLDDFGQGQTSLRFLSLLPLTEVKIDKTFVANLANPTQGAIATS